MMTLQQIAALTGGELKGDANFTPSGLCGLDEPKENAVSYASDIRKPETLANLNIGALFLPKEAKEKENIFSGNIIYVENPEWAFTQLMRAVDQTNKDIPACVHERAVVSKKAVLGAGVSVGANAVIEDDAQIGDGTIIYPNVYIGRNVKIGKACIIYSNVTVRENCVLKNKVILQAGAVIGSDGFGYIFNNNMHNKIPQLGNVILEDDVEIGANTTVDRAKINSTVIGPNTKVDNLVQIGHNVKVGAGSIIIAQVGIAGSTEIGSGVILAGQAGISGHLKIGDRAMVGPQAGIISDVKAGDKLMGSPARPYMEFMKVSVILGKLPEVYKEFLAFKKKFHL